MRSVSLVELLPDGVVSVSPSEVPDWGFARTPRCALMSASVEWVQSSYSSILHSNGCQLAVPNRDYAFEGLAAYQDGENWKFIDAVALGVRCTDQRTVPIRVPAGPTTVEASPWRVTYRYAVGGVDAADNHEDEPPLMMSYYLGQPLLRDALTGCVEVAFPEGLLGRTHALVPFLQPLLDIRHMFGASSLSDYRVEHDGSRLTVACRDRELTLFLDGFDAELFSSPETIPWFYKLGSGTRQETWRSDRQQTIFVGESRQVASFFRLRVTPGSRGFARLHWACGISPHPRRLSFEAVEQVFEESIRFDQQRSRQLRQLFSFQAPPEVASAILGRIAGLTKFKTIVASPHSADAPVQAPNAGAWWFRAPWFRDLFEGVLNSFETLMRLDDERRLIGSVVRLALEQYDDATGRIPSRLADFKGHTPAYNAADATFLCFLVGAQYVQRTNDIPLARRLLLTGLRCIERLRQLGLDGGESLEAEGPARLAPATQLVLCVPHHSWIDTHNRRVEYAGWCLEGLPNRISSSLVRDVYDKVTDPERAMRLFSAPNFFLPEINAQWLLMLSGLLSVYDSLGREAAVLEEIRSLHLPSRQDVAQLENRARDSFKQVFWDCDEYFLYNAVYFDGSAVDRAASESAVETVALLGRRVFSRDEMRSVWNHVRRSLLCYRTPVSLGEERAPFGLLARADDQRIYYDDQQYHSDVIWPKSTPYLARLLRLLGEDDQLRSLLINNLDHQMTEGAIFYNHELFSRPCGNNPSPGGRTGQNPVPVKNPIQFWSQWCDAYLDCFGARRDNQSDEPPDSAG